MARKGRDLKQIVRSNIVSRKGRDLKLRIGRNIVSKKGRDLKPRVGRTPQVKSFAYQELGPGESQQAD